MRFREHIEAQNPAMIIGTPTQRALVEMEFVIIFSTNRIKPVISSCLLKSEEVSDIALIESLPSNTIDAQCGPRSN